ncbi:MAG: NAD-dependent epimerase/dehydratase family protein [Sedimentisphaerales bacterium]|nr:NAD-dependent epimerase/dehydratase family protein [Sedimentisphaerales bacterium]
MEIFVIKRVLITGSSGMIGTRLSERLLSEGYEIICVDKRVNTWNEQVNKLTIIGDLRCGDTLKKLDKHVDMVINLAANARVYNLVLEPDLARENIDIAFNTLEFCRVNGISRYIFASSREVYGNTAEAFHGEADVRIRGCESTYTASKMAGEAMVHAYKRCYGLSFLILRFSNVYGMYDVSDRVVPRFIMNALEGGDLEIYGKEKVLDFTYIDDTVDGIIEAIRRFDVVKSDVLNIARGQGVSLAKLGEIILNQLASSSRLTFSASRTGEVCSFTADISRARELLGFCPEVALEEGVRRAVAWYREHLGRMKSPSSPRAKWAIKEAAPAEDLRGIGRVAGPRNASR